MENAFDHDKIKWDLIRELMVSDLFDLDLPKSINEYEEQIMQPISRDGLMWYGWKETVATTMGKEQIPVIVFEKGEYRLALADNGHITIGKDYGKNKGTQFDGVVRNYIELKKVIDQIGIE